MTVRRMLAAVLTVLLVATSVLLAAGSASAASKPTPRQLGFSWDGKKWSTKLTGTVFPRGTVLVPGQSVTKTFRIRNMNTNRSYLKITTAMSDRSGLVSSKALKLEAKFGGKSKWATFTSGQVKLKRSGLFSRKERLKISVRATLDPKAGNSTMNKAAGFSIKIESKPNPVKWKKPKKRKREAVLIQHQDAGSTGALGAIDTASSKQAPALGMPLVALAALIGTGLAFGTRFRTKKKISRTDQGVQA